MDFPCPQFIFYLVILHECRVILHIIEVGKNVILHEFRVILHIKINLIFQNQLVILHEMRAAKDVILHERCVILHGNSGGCNITRISCNITSYFFVVYGPAVIANERNLKSN